MMNLRIGVDLGGTNIAAAVVNDSGEILLKISNPTMAKEGQEGTVNRIIGTIKELIEKYDSRAEYKGIGIGVPGVCDIPNGIVKFAPNLFWKDVPIKEILQKEFSIPTYIDNDANAAALGEAWTGAGKDKRHIVCITLGTGVGSGLILNGDIFHGAQTAGELGHVTVLEDGPKCNCGNTGCLETLAAAPGIARIAKDAVLEGKETILNNYVQGEDFTGLTAKEVFDSAKEGDLVANKIVEDVARYLGLALANVINLLNPELIVIGGGVAAAGETLFVPLKKVVEERALTDLYNDVEIVAAQLGNDAGIIGAAALIK